MPVSDNPSPKRKLRAGIVVAAILVAMAVVTFVGMNLDHARENEEHPSPGTTEPE